MKMEETDETRSLISPKKNLARRSLSAQQGVQGQQAGGGKFFNQYRLLMDANRRRPSTRTSNKLSDQRNSIDELNSLIKTAQKTRSPNDFQRSQEQVTSVVVDNDRSTFLSVTPRLSTSNSSPIGFEGSDGGVWRKSPYQETLSYPMVTYLGNDGRAYANRKLSYDSVCCKQQHGSSFRRRRDNRYSSVKSMNLNTPFRWSARSRNVGFVEEGTTNTPMSRSGHKFSVPVTLSPTAVAQVHPTVQVRPSSPTAAGATGADPQQNPLWNVSNEYMRVAGYASPFNKLLSIKRKKTPLAERRSTDVEKGADDTAKTVVTDSGAAVPEGANNVVASKTPKRVYGRLYTASTNQKQLFKQRKDLFGRRIFVCNLSIVFAVAGIILAVVDAELSASGTIDKAGFASSFIRTMIVISTVVLLLSLTWYHAIEIKISVIDCGASDWRVALTWDRVAQVIFELLLCSVCPIPVNFNVWMVALEEDHRQFRLVNTPLQALLSVPMFLRLYWIGRFMALHSDQFRDAATRSIARLNRVTVNFAFVMKTLMVEHPLRVLFTFTCVFWLVIAWILVQCERYDGVPEQNHYLNAVWFIIITFMSIGYGDVVPNTYCGRVVAITTGIVGAGVSSALIAVMSLKLELSRAEKHVNNFMTDTKLSRQRKDAAATVLQHTWFIHKYRAVQRAQDEIKLRFHQRKFLAAINEFRRIKWEQRKLAEQGNALVDVAKLQNDMHTTLWEMQQTQDQLASQLSVLTQRVQEMYDAIVFQTLNRKHPPSAAPMTPLKVAVDNPQNHLLSPPSIMSNGTPKTDSETK